MINKINKFDRLIRILEKELQLTGTEITETLWLAMQRKSHSSIHNSQIPSGAETAVDTKTPPAKSSPRNPEDSIFPTIPQNNSDGETAVDTKTPSVPPPAKSSPIKPEDSTYPTVPPKNPYAEVTPKTNSANKGYLPIKAPDVSTLRHPLKIARAFRPLMEYISYGKAVLLDEEATVERIAELEGICVPVLKSPLELQFDLALVIDRSDSMIFWRRTTQELQQLFKRYGIFRNVKTWRMVTDTQGEILLKQGIRQNSRSHHFYSPQKLIDPTSRGLILIVSDCVSDIWRNGKAFSLLESWGKQNVVAIVQILPERLWLRTALSLGTMVQLDCLQPKVPNRNLFVREVWLGSDRNLQTGIKVPVFSLEPELIETWSEMVVGKGIIGAGGFVFSSLLKPEPKQISEDTKTENLTSAERVYNFQMSSSEMAQELAKLLSATPVINLPIVRLIQNKLLRESQQVHVAEVFLGNILKPQSLITPDTNYDEVQYKFIDEEIRDILLQDSPRKNSQEIITAISLDFAKRLGKSLQEFLALLKKPDELENLKTEKNVADLDIKYFATVTTKVLKRLGGAYARFAEEIEQSQNEIYGNTATLKDINLDNLESFEFTATVATIVKLKTILLVEDNPNIIQEVSENLLSHYNINVIGIDDVDEVIQLAESGEIDLILINYNLPRIRYQNKQVGGLEIIRILRANSNISPSLPIVGFSWVADIANKFLESGADGFYDKRELFDRGDYQKFVDYLQEIFLLSSNFQVFQCTTPTVNQRGEIIEQNTNLVRYFTENLPNNINLEMVAIPGGTFTMGSPKSEKESRDRERPQHNVTVSPFFMGKYPVTQRQWRAIASRKNLKVSLDLKQNPSRFQKPYQDIDRWQRPVESVNWYEAVEFCQRLSKLTGRNYRLPSEAEWEYACRGMREPLNLEKGETYPPFYFGETITGDVANYRASKTYGDEQKRKYRGQTTPVGQFPPNSFGLYDMHGNVWEWCADDWHDNYENAPTDGSAWLDSNKRENMNNRAVQEPTSENFLQRMRNRVSNIFNQNEPEPTSNYNDEKQKYTVLRGGSWFSYPDRCRSAYRLSSYRRDDFSFYIGFRLVCATRRTE